MTVLTGEGSFEITPQTEFGWRFIEMRNEAIRNGMKLYRSNDLINALEEDRAGKRRLGEIMGKSSPYLDSSLIINAVMSYETDASRKAALILVDSSRDFVLSDFVKLETGD